MAVAYFGVLLIQPPGIYDEGLIVSGAERVLHGQLPYRDFNTGYPPAQFYTIAGVFSVFGSSLLAERIWDTAWRLAIIVLVITLAKEATQTQRVQPVPLICAGLLTGVIGFRLYPMITGTLPCLAAIWCAVRYLKGRGLRWLFFSGMAGGAAVLYRHDLAACVCGAIVVASCCQSFTERKRRCFQFPAVFCLGVLLVAAVPVLYFWFNVPHDALVQSFIDFPRMNLPGRHLPLRGPGSTLAWRVLYLPLAIILAAAITLRWVIPEYKSSFVLLLTSTAAALILALQRLETPHAYPAIIFSMVLLCACIAVWQSQNRKLLPRLFLAGAIFCYMLFPLLIWAWQMTGPGEAEGGIAPLDVRRYSTNEPPNEIARAGPIRLRFDERQAIVYIQRYLPQGRSLYVGAANHGLEWYNDALFYFLADRPQATRFDMFVPGITTSAAVQSEILREIREKQTAYLVLFSAPPSHEPNLSSIDNGVRVLDNAIRRDYIQVAVFGRYTIWHVRSL
jgi:hypothetical protein